MQTPVQIAAARAVVSVMRGVPPEEVYIDAVDPAFMLIRGLRRALRTEEVFCKAGVLALLDDGEPSLLPDNGDAALGIACLASHLEATSACA